MDPPIPFQPVRNVEIGFWVLYLDDIPKNPFFYFETYAPMCTKIEVHISSLSFVANFGRIIPPKMEAHTCDMGELCHTCLH